LYPKGGAETYNLEVGKKLQEFGHTVEYFGMFDEKNTVGNSLGVYTDNLDFHGHGLHNLTYPFKIIYSKEAKRKIQEVLRDFKPDVVHLNNINYQLTPSIIDGIKEMNIPMVQTLHDPQLVCPNHMMFIPGKKEVCDKCVEHSAIHCLLNKCIHDSAVKSVFGAIEGTTYKHRDTYEKIDKLICPSEFIERNTLRDKRFQGKTIMLRNFVTIKEVPNVEKEDYVLYFGRLSDEKGIDLIIEAAKKLPEVKFVMAGGGPKEADISPIENIEYVGFKSGDDLAELITRARVAVFPSILNENSPLSVLESISFGTPVIGSLLGGIPELIENGKTGLIMEHLTPADLAEKIQRVMSDDKLASELSKNCLEARDTMMGKDEYIEEILKIYESVRNEVVE
jgi:glycosyltransferase involved in cell wall biosynthesis